MRKLFLVLIGILFSVNCFAAAALITQTEYGYTITGGTSATLIPQDTWLTSTAYTVGQVVTNTGVLYRCTVAHTSGTFSTDLTNLKWVKIGYATLYLYQANFNPAASTDTIAFTSLASTDNTTQMAAFNLNLNQESMVLTHPQTFGTPFRKLTLTMTSASDVVNIYVYKDNFTGQNAGSLGNN